jgi:MFS transporter, MHS family, proline/betaine transporter
MNKLTAKNIIALILGNAIEWYDYFIFSFISVYLAKLFFPSASAMHSILAITASFGASFLMRPLGGAILGRYADQNGRIAAFKLSIILMAVALLLLCFTPTYQRIGIVAPLIVILARLIQGFAAGGEFAISSAILFELAPFAKRGFYTSLHSFGQMLAILFSSVIATLISHQFTIKQIEDGVWRIPFIIGLLIIPIGIYLRRHFTDTKSTPHHTSGHSIITIINSYRAAIIHASGLVGGGTVGVYINLSYIPIYSTRYLALTANDAFFAVLISVSMLLLLIPVFGYLSDKISKRGLLIWAMVLYILELYPCFNWLNTDPSLIKLIIVQCLLCFPLSIYYGAITAVLVERFPYAIRTTGLSIACNSGVLIFGSFAQLIVTLAIEATASPLAIVIYPTLCAAICLAAACCYRDTQVETLSIQQNDILIA